MQLMQAFDARQVQPSSGFAPPPPLADYHVRIVASEGKQVKDNNNHGYLELTLEIMDGPYAGRKIPDRLNLFNTNQQTVQIAYGQLSAYCHVTGQFNITDSRQLWNHPFIATIGPQSGNSQYSNVFQVKDMNGNVPGQAPATAAAPPFAAPPAQAPPPFAAPAPPAAAPAWAPPGTQQAPPFAAPPQPTQPGAQPWPPQPTVAPAPAAPPWNAPPPTVAQPPAAPPWQPGAAVQPAAPPWAQR